jgi:hypothetical protein
VKAVFSWLLVCCLLLLLLLLLGQSYLNLLPLL